MSQKIEHIFKEALQNQEVPYNPQAWDALNARLDKTMPVSGKTSFGPKAALILAIGLIGAASVYYLTTYSSNPINNAIKTEQTAENSTKNNAINNNPQSSTPITASDNEEIKKSNNSEDLKLNLKTQAEPKDLRTFNTTNIYRGPGNAQANNPTGSDQKSMSNMSDMVQPPRKTYVNDPLPSSSGMNVQLPIVSNTCQHMSKEIFNKSDVNVVVEYPSGKEIVVLANSSKKVDFNEAGKYSISNGNGITNSFTIYENTSADFAMDLDNLYKNGVPTTEVKLLNTGTTGEWTSSKGNQSYSGSTADFHFYKKGNYQINVTTTNSKGCASAISKTVTVKDDYNLLAVTAFKPQDIDPRVNTFMPQALKERDTEFALIIIDPKDGNVVYQTTDATAGWDGVDRRTGKPAVHGTNYIWKVSIAKPLAGEAIDYKGIVTIIID
jgi:hypothetical protein